MSGRTGGGGRVLGPGRDTLGQHGPGFAVRGGGPFAACPAAPTSGCGWKVILRT
jgi:hypothetical protein